MHTKHFKVYACLTFLSLLVVVTLVGYSLLNRGMARAASASSCGQWSIIPSANPDPGNLLNAVAVVSANDIWTVGSGLNSSGFSQTLAEHWNGTGWLAVTTPNVGQLGNYLRGVAATSTNDVWAVGDYQSKSTAERTLIEHWDGTSWTRIASPNVGKNSNFLFGVAATSTNDIWAIGYYMNSQNIFRTLIEHWDGTSWKLVASPNAGTSYNSLNSVAVVSAHDVWSVGSVYGSKTEQTLIEHWNGSKWQIVTSVNPGSIGNSLWAVTAVSTSDVWATGNYINSNSTAQTLVEHWNGTVWKAVNSPTPSTHPHVIPNSGGEPVTLFDVTAVSMNNVWAVGDYINTSGNYDTLIEHWNGKTWSIVTSPNANGTNSFLRGVAHITGTMDVWSVGYSSGSGGDNTLTEYYC